MDYLAEKFARLGTDNAPGQEGLQKAEDLPMIGNKLEGPAVDFSHGDVNAHQPIPGSLETFEKHYCVDGTYQAYTEYRGKGAIREYLAEKLAEYSGAPVDPKTEIILTPGTQGALFLAMGSLVGRGDKVAIVEPDYFDNRKLVEFFEGEMVPIHMNWKDAAPHTSGIDLKELEEAFKNGVKLLFSHGKVLPFVWLFFQVLRRADNIHHNGLRLHPGHQNTVPGFQAAHFLGNQNVVLVGALRSSASRVALRRVWRVWLSTGCHANRSGARLSERIL